MSKNPYESPQSLGAPALALSSEQLKWLSSLQRGLIICLIGRLALVVAVILSNNSQTQPLVGLGILAASFVLALVSFALLLLTAIARKRLAIGLLWCMLSLIPCVGLISLWVVARQTASELEQAGIRVGMFGAELESEESGDRGR